jgi:predicted CopG family antitoxin
MGTKTISITDEAYALLKSFKGEGESFTDAIKKLAGRRSLDGIIGFLSEEEAAEMEGHIKEARKMEHARLERLIKEMG